MDGKIVSASILCGSLSWCLDFLAFALRTMKLLERRKAVSVFYRFLSTVESHVAAVKSNRGKTKKKHGN